MFEQERQAIIDGEQVRVLAICYGVSAGFHALFSLFGLLYALTGVFVTTTMSRMPVPAGQEAPPEFIGWFVGIIGLAMFAIMIAAAALQLLVAMRLRQHRSRILCMVVAALSCLEIPYGTALGVFTFIVLSRKSVVLAFEG